MFRYPVSMRVQGVLRITRGAAKQIVGKAIGKPALIADGVKDRTEGGVLRLISKARPILRLVKVPHTIAETVK
jgi:uncharacterized protein YjbJ (UPF0337 family)